jgi:hypothetical protein
MKIFSFRPSPRIKLKVFSLKETETGLGFASIEILWLYNEYTTEKSEVSYIYERSEA